MRKKENVNNYGIEKKEKRKFKLNKKFKAIFAIGLAAVIGTSGFLITNHVVEEREIQRILQEADEEYMESGENYVDDEYIPEFEINQSQDKAKKNNYNNNLINLKNSDYMEFVEYLNNIKIDYKYEDLYGLDKAYDIYKKNGDDKEIAITAHSHDIRSDGVNLTVDDLYNTVIKNNKIDKEVGFDKNTDDFDKLSRREIRKACEIIVDYINKEVNSNPDLDLDEICCSLYDLQMFSDSTAMENAYVDSYNRMIINNKNIETGLASEYDSYRQVIVHETEHLIQNACEDMEKEGEHEIGNSHIYEKLDINPLYNSWLLEASAERSMSKILNEEPSTYPTQISYLESLIMIGMLNKEVSLSDVENLTYNKDPNELYKIFGANTEEQKKEIHKLLYSIEIMQSQDSNFYDLYKKKYNVDLLFDEEASTALNQELRIEILESFSVKFYHSLASQLTNGKMTLNDVMYMINMYESDVYGHLLYNETDRIETSGDFFDFYVDLQNNFFDMISSYVNYDINDLIEILNNYSMYTYDSNGNEIKNYNLSYLEKDKVDFLQEEQKKNYKTGIPSIQYMKDYYISKFFK